VAVSTLAAVIGAHDPPDTTGEIELSVPDDDELDGEDDEELSDEELLFELESEELVLDEVSDGVEVSDEDEVLDGVDFEEPEVEEPASDEPVSDELDPVDPDDAGEEVELADAERVVVSVAELLPVPELSAELEALDGLLDAVRA
jgi:hypothetical protein